MTYPGGKNGAGVYQKIINQMPKHQHYIELFCGHGSIFRAKKRATTSILVDLDIEPLKYLCIDFGFSPAEGCFATFRDGDTLLTIINDSAMEVIRCPGLMRELEQTLIYADPTYIATECTLGRPIYKFDMPFAYQHEEFLTEFIKLPCMKMISHYKCSLYDDMLAGWRQISYNSPTRGGWKTDTLYMSFPEPVELHDYQYLGDTYRKREKIKIKRQNWERKITNMPVLERSLLFEVIDNIRSGVHHEK